MRSRIFVAVAACAALVGSMMATTGAAGAAAGSQASISSDEIKVGGLIETQFAGSDVGARARFADENAKGGVNGRKITYVDGQTYAQGNTAAALAEAQRLVQQEGVSVIVPALTSVPPAQFLAQQKVPTYSWNITPARVGHAVVLRHHRLPGGAVPQERTGFGLAARACSASSTRTKAPRRAARARRSRSSAATTRRPRAG